MSQIASNLSRGITNIISEVAAIPNRQPKSGGFNFFPVGVIKKHDAGKWALYHWPAYNISFIVVDIGQEWKIERYLGLLEIKYTQDFMKVSRPCCNGD